MEDFTSFKRSFVYPESAYVPTQFQSHRDFLHAAALRHNINAALHVLTIDGLQNVLEYAKNAAPVDQ